MPHNNQREKMIYLRQWVGNQVTVRTATDRDYTGQLTNIVFDESRRLMYIMLDDRVCLNFDHIIEIGV